MRLENQINGVYAKYMGIVTNLIQLLNSPEVTLTDFELFGHRINGRDYRHIASCIRDGHIQVVQSSTMQDTKASYNRRYNCFIVGANPSPPLAVHEATHAINDWHGRALRPVADEGLAYVASMIYVCRMMPGVQHDFMTGAMRQRVAGLGRMCGQDEGVCNNAAIGYATVIAATLRDGGTPSARVLREYEGALVRDPMTLEPTRTRAYDNIRRVEIPLDLLVSFGGQVITD
jgi:hypothetical protein